jgi:hypothetical protein
MVYDSNVYSNDPFEVARSQNSCSIKVIQIHHVYRRNSFMTAQQNLQMARHYSEEN